jgi:hypothetical protein
MKFDMILFGITAIVLYNIYLDNKLMEQVMTYHKYYKMAAVLIVSILIYRLFRWTPTNKTRSLVMHTNNLIKSLPVSNDSTMGAYGSGGKRTNASATTATTATTAATAATAATIFTPAPATVTPLRTGTKTTKRVVSETKKKFVAARQNWTCDKCRVQLNHTFEVDHKVRLDAGGTNDVDNLVAMCRECHGYKTSMENM